MGKRWRKLNLMLQMGLYKLTNNVFIILRLLVSRSYKRSKYDNFHYIRDKFIMLLSNR